MNPVQVDERLSDYELFLTHVFQDGPPSLEGLGDLWDDARDLFGVVGDVATGTNVGGRRGR